MDAYLHLTGETAGNGAITNRTYSPETGNLLNIDATASGNLTLTNQTYAWDTIGNLSSRTDSVNGYAEDFCYDNLNRLQYYNVIRGGSGSCTTGGQNPKSIDYDTATSGVGTAISR
jgi:hypothetical protein